MQCEIIDKEKENETHKCNEINLCEEIYVHDIGILSSISKFRCMSKKAIGWTDEKWDG